MPARQIDSENCGADRLILDRTEKYDVLPGKRQPSWIKAK